MPDVEGLCVDELSRSVRRRLWTVRALTNLAWRFALVYDGAHRSFEPGANCSRRMLTTHDPSQNHLLAALSAEDFERVSSHLKLVPLELGSVLYESGSRQRAVYFPTTAIVSLLYTLADGASAEIAVVGNEGIIGVSLFMGGETTPSRAVVQSAGHAYRLPGKLLKEEFIRGDAMQHLLLRYTQALLTQMAQTAVCNRHHSLDQQLCRWLLLSLDRLIGDELVMTQELIANMLGVRREGVTEAAGNLQNAGLIKYSRGRITVLDRSGLEARTCECYAVVKKEFDRLLPVDRRAGSK
jgi:CRP-like cAMP-binding protein